ncbi:hypothetical protein FBUS_00560 [Fasciolopsis buskii]|uniref:LicD/FKTN/FKRP nucleotidyltransferase domain-containing protein n=1 Tax=Fasciolopsis buskii TaxID=27845 RepID=A0A8E0VIQ7_9TREM|nr:hypothetical protein FBUS_00560 [Fasciolopsis buski]
MHASKCRRADYVKVCLLTLLLLTIGAYFSYSVSQNNAKTVFKIVKSLCELHAELQTPCCPQGQDTYSIKSWFDCILRNSTDPVASERFPSTDSTKLNPNYRDWVDRKAPAYRMPQYYYEIRADHHSGNRSCPVEMDLRETNYHLLRYWIELTKKNKIVWWITFGTLLGAIREKDFTPYDTDVDVQVLGYYEPVLRSLAVRRGQINPRRINLVTRIGSPCQHDGGLKMDCDGFWQTRQTDRCAICYPLGRLFYGSGGYIDIYSSIIRAQPTPSPLHPDHVHFIVEEQGSGHLDKHSWSFNLNEIFPLATCEYMGLILPCPRDAHSVLSRIYGENYRKPSYFCDPRTGNWY